MTKIEQGFVFTGQDKENSVILMFKARAYSLDTSFLSARSAYISQGQPVSQNLCSSKCESLPRRRSPMQKMSAEERSLGVNVFLEKGFSGTAGLCSLLLPSEYAVYSDWTLILENPSCTESCFVLSWHRCLSYFSQFVCLCC